MKNLPIDLLDQNHISKYDQWCMYLYNQVVHEHSLKTKKLYRDDRVLSPCRNVLVAVREDRDLFIDSEYSNKE
jgi:hypothetical protein